jgi:hypothetical protein
MYTHKARPIKEIAPVDRLRELIDTGELPSDEKQRHAIFEFIKEYVLEQGEMYTKTFEKLNFQEQAISINGQIRSLEQAIQAHVRIATNSDDTWTTCIEQVGRLRTRHSQRR